MKKVLITGITGFVGQHLAYELLSQKEYHVTGTYRSASSLDQLGELQDQITLKLLNLDNPDAVSEFFKDEKPDHIYHLAAQASPFLSFKNPSDTITNNIIAQLNVFEALREHAMKSTRVLSVATGEMYGVVKPSDIPIDEDTPLRPISPYSVSKIAQDYMSLQYVLAHDLDIVRMRPFNHIGPGQKEGYVVADFAKQIAEIEKGKREPILSVGNLEAKRDFTDVRDMVKGYVLALEKGEKGEVYNIGSGNSHRINDMLQLLLSYSTKMVELKIDPARFRPIDVPEVVCDYGKFHKRTGWKPEIPFEKTLQEILDYWRKIV
ncbi:MAG: GDP-mannose 4,6-dehydratase [Candidatus Levybacteria bacterium]|nr:GDP-mannose 4,6-dehydratase [Candidatus Levybacteria bacterium]